MAKGNFKLAIRTLKTAKWRSVLTVFGVVVGVVSVITIVSLGEGVKREILGEVNRTGSDLISVRPGNIVTRDNNGTITKVDTNAAYGFGSGSLSENDIKSIETVQHAQTVSPLAYIRASAQTNDTVYNDGFVLGASPELPTLLNQRVEFGTYFTEGEESRHVAVIGKRVAEQLFKENVPVGLTMTVRGEDFIVRGVFEEFSTSTLGAGIDLNRAIFVPYPMAKEITDGTPQIARVLVRPDSPDKANDLVAGINNALRIAHKGQSDITVLKQDENLTVSSSLLDLLSKLIVFSAVVSLCVGGIGIMNIMLVSVTERTREIGIRKAVGATNRQIRSQFLIEAIILSFSGGVLGVMLSYVLNFGLRVGTNLKPVIDWRVVLLAVATTAVAGTIFGLAPAIKASRKDPIESLRYE